MSKGSFLKFNPAIHLFQFTERLQESVTIETCRPPRNRRTEKPHLQPRLGPPFYPFVAVLSNAKSQRGEETKRERERKREKERNEKKARGEDRTGHESTGNWRPASRRISIAGPHVPDAPTRRGVAAWHGRVTARTWFNRGSDWSFLEPTAFTDAPTDPRTAILMPWPLLSFGGRDPPWTKDEFRPYVRRILCHRFPWLIAPCHAPPVYFTRQRSSRSFCRLLFSPRLAFRSFSLFFLSLLILRESDYKGRTRIFADGTVCEKFAATNTHDLPWKRRNN